MPMMWSRAVLSSMIPPSTDSSASRLCGGTRRRFSSMVAIPTPRAARALLAGVVPGQQVVERLAVLVRELLAALQPEAGRRRRLEHEEAPQQHTGHHPAPQHDE